MTQQIYTTPTPFSGTNISIPNSGKGYTSNMVIKGQTYQNLVDFSQGYTRVGNEDYITVANNKISFSSRSDGGNVRKILTLLKPNTLYTICTNVYTLPSKDDIPIRINDYDFNTANNTYQLNIFRSKITKTGLYKDTFTTSDKPCTLVFYASVNNVNFSCSLPIILEGDWSNKEVPSSITGIESVGEKENNKISLLSHNKNLIDGGLDYYNCQNPDYIEKLVDGSYKIKRPVGISGGFWLQISPLYNYIFKKDTTYYVNFDIEYNNCNKVQFGLVCPNATTDSTRAVSSQNHVDGYITVNKDISKKMSKEVYKYPNPLSLEIGFLTEYVEDISKEAYIIIKNVMITEKTYNDYETTKEDKKEILLSLDGGLKSLPNGVADTIEQREDGVYLVQRVGKVVFNGADNEDWTKVGNANNYTLVYHRFNAKRISVAPYCYPFLNNQLPYSNKKLDNLEEEGCYTAQDGNVCVSISNNKLESPDSDGFKKWLQHNNMIGYYMLEKPIEVKLDINNLNLETFKDLTYISSENNISPILEFKEPILRYKEINPIQLKTTQNGTEVNVYPYSTPELITFGDNETLADKINNLGNTHTHNNATVTSDGFMSKESYAKLESLTEYTHPSTHAATMITEDSTHRFITDTERNNWNAKASTNVATSSTNGLMSNTDKQKIDRISNSFDIVYDANTETIRFRFR